MTGIKSIKKSIKFKRESINIYIYLTNIALIANWLYICSQFSSYVQMCLYVFEFYYFSLAFDKMNMYFLPCYVFHVCCCVIKHSFNPNLDQSFVCITYLNYVFYWLWSYAYIQSRTWSAWQSKQIDRLFLFLIGSECSVDGWFVSLTDF